MSGHDGALRPASQRTKQRDRQHLPLSDANGNEVKDGTTLTLSTLTEGKISTGLYIKNISGKQTAGNPSIDITNMPNGSFGTCSFGSCLPAWAKGGVYQSSSCVVEANAQAQDIATEWVPAAYGDWTATMQIEVREVKTTTKFGITQSTLAKSPATAPR